MIWLIGIGGSFGAAARFLASMLLNKKMGSMHSFPFATWLINITGSFLLGVLTQLYATHQMSDAVWFFLGVGFCGAYTTFSTFGYETIILIEANKIRVALVYVSTSMIVGLISATIGFYVMG
jgi:fluoride exporter